MLDPLGKNKKLEPEEEERLRHLNYNKISAFNKAKEQGPGVHVDTTEYEKILRGEDEQTVRAVLQEIKEEKKGQ